MSEHQSMPGAPETWRFTYEADADLPLLAWLARIDWPEVRVWCGAGYPPRGVRIL